MRTNILLSVLIAVLAVAPFALAGEAIEKSTSVPVKKPWYIGPKGGDLRKDHTAFFSEPRAAVHGNDPATESVGATPNLRNLQYIGPKGGDTRKGAFPR